MACHKPPIVMAHFCFFEIFPNDIVIMFYALSMCGLHFLKPFKALFYFSGTPFAKWTQAIRI